MSKLIIQESNAENCAVNVYGEAGTVFWKSIRDNNGLAGKMSIHQIRALFDKAVIPAIKKVRDLDRGDV